MKKFLLLLLALVATALLGYYCTYKMKISTIIETGIHARSQAALDEKNMSWANLSVDGRDITLTGIAPSEAAKKAADQAVRIYGYNIIHNQLILNTTGSTSTKPSTVKEHKLNANTHINESDPIISKQSIQEKMASTELPNSENKIIVKNITQKTASTTKTKEMIAKQRKDCQNKFNRILKTGIHFKSSSTLIQKTSFSVLNKMASMAKECDHFNLQIHGYTDSSGKTTLNKELSHGRAKAVVKYLISKEIDDKRLTALGHGASTPIASNRTKRGRAKNRRIEITVEEKQ
ncbi:MAG: OmpA family protein [Cocleimonas sp.]|nr:OmpA family protein [Cocleimonas sp.]